MSTIAESVPEAVAVFPSKANNACCSAPPSFLWFLQTSWPSNQTTDEPTFTKVLLEKEPDFTSPSVTFPIFPDTCTPNTEVASPGLTLDEVFEQSSPSATPMDQVNTPYKGQAPSPMEEFALVSPKDNVTPVSIFITNSFCAIDNMLYLEYF